MGRGEELTEEERQVIIYQMSEGATAVRIGKLLKRDTRTIKKAIDNINYARKPRTDKGKCMIPKESIEMIQKVAQKHPGMSSKEIFDIAGVGGIGKSLRCSVLKKAGYVRNSFRRPSISVDNISTESLINIQAIMETNPHLSSKDIFELAGVPDVGKHLREQILKELTRNVRSKPNATGAITNAANVTGAVTNTSCERGSVASTASDISATGTENIDEIAGIIDEDDSVRLSEGISEDVVATGNRDTDPIIIKEELFIDNRRYIDPLFQ